jgi:steroid 5-alpha reductase family enzyme
MKLLIIEAAVIISYMTVWFVIAQAIKRNDIADILWGTGFIVAAVTALISSDAAAQKPVLVFILVFLWGTRLSIHIYIRNRGKPEDARYRKWREDWGEHATIRAFFDVFMLQGMLMLVISVPVIYMISSSDHPLGWFDIVGGAVWLTGFLFEAIGDYQLIRFKKLPSSKGKIMTTGLWSWTRHPNYFGEVTLWWGIYLMALSLPFGWATIIGPLTITFLILKVSGIPLLEKKYEGKPEFEEYKRRTSAFFPLPPRKES